MVGRSLNAALFTVLILSVSACGLFRRKEKPPEPIPPTTSQPVVETQSAPDSGPVETAPATVSPVEAAPGALVEQSGPPAKAEPSKANSSSSVPAEQSLLWLANGNKRFVKARLRNDGQSRKDVKRLTEGQTPHAIVLSCSDSRVPPELVFDQKLGEIFVVRTFGESLDANVIASIEYAVAHLHSRLILVMGHTQCGAVNAAIQTINGGDAGSAALNQMVAGMHPHLKPLMSKGGSGTDGSIENFVNARGAAAELVARSAMIKNAVEKGDVMIQTALYHVDNGTVEFDGAVKK